MIYCIKYIGNVSSWMVGLIIQRVFQNNSFVEISQMDMNVSKMQLSWKKANQMSQVPSNTQSEPKKELTNSFCCVNFKSDQSPYLLRQEWRKFKSQVIFQQSLTVHNETKAKPLFNFWIIHSNSDNHLARVMFMERLVTNKQIKPWPVFQAQKEYSNENNFEFQLAIKCSKLSDGNKYTYYTTNRVIKNFNLQKEDKEIIVRIRQDEDGNVFAIVFSKHGDEQFFLMDYQLQQHSKSLYVQGHNPLFLPKIHLVAQKLKVIGDSTSNYQDKLFKIQQKQSTEIKNQKDTIKQLFKDVREGSPQLQNWMSGQQSNYLGNCYAISALDQIVTKAEFIFDLIMMLQDSNQNRVCAVLNIDGRPEAISTDYNLLKLIGDYGHLYYCHYPDVKSLPSSRRMMILTKCIFLEKIIARIFGGYDNLSAGFPSEIFMMLTDTNTKKYLAADNMARYLQAFITWTKQYQKMKEIRKKMIKKEKRQTDKEKGTIFLGLEAQLSKFTQREDINEQYYHFITVNNFNQAKLEKILMKNQNIVSKSQKNKGITQQSKYKQDKKQIANFLVHSYSFQGIFFTRYDEINPPEGETYIKLRQPRGKQCAKIFVTRWNNNHKELKFCKQHSQYKIKHYIRVDKKLDNRQNIKLEQNQFLITLKQLKELNAIITITIYQPKNHYKFDQIYFKPDTPARFKIHMQHVSDHTVTLHFRNRRRSFIATNNDQEDRQTVKQWKYPEAQFNLLKDYKKSPLSHDKNHSSLFFQNKLSGYQNNYQVSISLKGQCQLQKRFKQSYISLSSPHSENYIKSLVVEDQIGHNNIKFQGLISFQQKQGSHSFFIQKEGRYNIRCSLDLNLSKQCQDQFKIYSGPFDLIQLKIIDLEDTNSPPLLSSKQFEKKDPSSRQSDQFKFLISQSYQTKEPLNNPIGSFKANIKLSSLIPQQIEQTQFYKTNQAFIENHFLISYHFQVKLCTDSTKPDKNKIKEEKQDELSQQNQLIKDIYAQRKEQTGSVDIFDSMEQPEQVEPKVEE